MSIQVDVVAEYACGHAPRKVISGEWTTVKDALSKQVHEIDFTCQKCGRGAAKVALMANGKKIGELGSDQFKDAGKKGIAKISLAPHPDRN